jgi:hypothetical protein
MHDKALFSRYCSIASVYTYSCAKVNRYLVVSATDGQMQCDCYDGFVGKHCHDCEQGTYQVEDKCFPCNCSGNEKPNSPPVCNSDGQ